MRRRLVVLLPLVAVSSVFVVHACTDSTPYVFPPFNFPDASTPTGSDGGPVAMGDAGAPPNADASAPDARGPGPEDSGPMGHNDAAPAPSDGGGGMDDAVTNPTDAGSPADDAATTPDAGTPGMDAAPGAPDSGAARYCGALASPAQGGTCCACPAGMTCDANNCYGGAWCSSEPGSATHPACYCVTPPSLCLDGAPHGPGSSGGPLACASQGSYSTDTGPPTRYQCGVYRWDVKTVSDGAANQISMTPQVVTLEDLTSLPQPGVSTNTPRMSGAEMTIYEIRNISVTYFHMSTDDADYHLAFNDPMRTSMVGEIPFPGCLSNASNLFSCMISRARAVLDAQIGNNVLNGPCCTNCVAPCPQYPDLPATVVGVGFFDEIHTVHGQAPNGIELHPILAICFGLDCDPYAQ